MKGIKFEIENKFDNYLYKILEKVSNDNYVWKIIDDDAFCEKSMFFFGKDEYDNDSFFELVKNNKAYIVFCTILLFKKNMKITEIETPKDFLDSDCELILLITDNVFVEVYCKVKEMDNQIKNNLLNLNITFQEKDIFDRNRMNGRSD